MLLAAGRGERLRPLTDHLPKCLMQAGGRTLAAWHLLRLHEAGIREVVVNTCWLGAAVEAALGDGAGFGLSIAYSREAQALETAGGIRQALPLLGAEPFLVLNGDVWCDADLAALAGHAAALGPARAAHLLLVDNPAEHPLGDFGLAGGRILPDGAPRLTFSGIGAYHPCLFSGIEAGARVPLGPLLRQEAAAGRIGGAHHRGRWTDVGTPQRLAQLQHALAPVGPPGPP